MLCNTCSAVQIALENAVRQAENKAAIFTAVAGSPMPSGMDTFGFYWRATFLLSPLSIDFHISHT